MRALIMILMAAFVLSFSPVAQAANSTKLDEVDIDIPEGYSIDKRSDISAALLSRLFGSTWHDVIGDKSTMEDVNKEAEGSAVQTMNTGLGLYSGLIVSILGILNLAAMAFVATSIIYMWAIFAVTTAHEGKQLGGSLYNSLWVPVRHACSFTLTVPVLNGLSIMQVAIMACVALSINFANRIWDASGAYIVEHAHVGILDAANPMLESEAYSMVPLMFQTSVLTLVEMSTDNKLNEENEKKAKEYGEAEYKSYDITGVTGIESMDPIHPKIYRNYNYKTGKIDISLVTPRGIDPGQFGVISVDGPKMECSKQRDIYDKTTKQYTWGCKPPEDPEARQSYEDRLDLANVRVNNIIALWREVHQLAIEYLKSYSSTGLDQGAACLFPKNRSECEPAVVNGTGAAGQMTVTKLNQRVDSLIKEFVTNMTDQSSAKVQTIIDRGKTGTKEALQKAIDSNGKESKYGWMSAGLFTFSLASLQKKIDDQIMTRISMNQPVSSKNLEDRHWFFASKRYDSYNSVQKASLDNMPGYISDSMFMGSRYSATVQSKNEDDTFHNIAATVVSFFVFGDGTSNTKSKVRGSILATVLNEFAIYDPIVVIQSFGNRLTQIGEAAMITSLIGTAFTPVKFAGFGIIGVLFVAGAIFAYIVPITPVVFWLRALLSWLYMVVEAMVAAPFWCCTHALPEGHGFAGTHAKRGYMMLLDIVIRPTLLVLGAVFAVAIIQAAGWMFNVIFNSWFANITGTFISIGVAADIAFSIVVMSTMYYVSFMVFTKGLNYLPEKVLSWCGSGGGGLRDEESSTAAIIAAGGMAGRAQGAIGNFGNATTGAIRGAQGAIGKGLNKLAGGTQGNVAKGAKRDNDIPNMEAAT